MNIAEEKTTISVQKNQNPKRREGYTGVKEKVCCLTKKTQKTETRIWADLHEDLLRIIIQKLCLYDRVRLRLACKEWRTKIVETEPTNFLPRMLWCESCKSYQDRKLTLEGILFDPNSRKHYPVKCGKCKKSRKMSLLYDARPCASKHGWLPFAKGLRKNVFALYHISRENYMATYTFGEKNWRTTQVVVQAEEWQRAPSMVYSVEKDELCCIFLSCVVFFWGRMLVKFEVAGRRWRLLKERSVYDLPRMPKTLMEHKGQLVSVTFKDVNERFHVYRFDWSFMDWIAPDSLGSGAIFLDFHWSWIAVEETSSSKDFICSDNHRNESISCFSLKTQKLCNTSVYYSYELMRGTLSGTAWIHP